MTDLIVPQDWNVTAIDISVIRIVFVTNAKPTSKRLHDSFETLLHYGIIAAHGDRYEATDIGKLVLKRAIVGTIESNDGEVIDGNTKRHRDG